YLDHSHCLVLAPATLAALLSTRAIFPNARVLSRKTHFLDLSDRNDGSRFDDRRLGLVGDQLAQERNQHDEHNTAREAAEAKLGEEFRVPRVGSDNCGARRLWDHSRKV